MSEARPGLVSDHLHASHDEPDADCAVCLDRGEPELEPQAPDRGWYIDAEGWVKVDA